METISQLIFAEFVVAVVSYILATEFNINIRRVLVFAMLVSAVVPLLEVSLSEVDTVFIEKTLDFHMNIIINQAIGAVAGVIVSRVAHSILNILRDYRIIR